MLDLGACVGLGAPKHPGKRLERRRDSTTTNGSLRAFPWLAKVRNEWQAGPDAKSLIWAAYTGPSEGSL